jgi:hypothetical protein
MLSVIKVIKHDCLYAARMEGAVFSCDFASRICVDTLFGANTNPLWPELVSSTDTTLFENN